MKVALISMRPKIANKQANLKTMESYVKKTSADMYIFGEICLTGYRCKDELRDLAEPVTGPSISYMKKVAKAHTCYLIFGMPLLDKTIKGLIHNAAVLIHPNGTVDTYNKWFLPTFGPFEEKLFFDEGEHLPVFKTKFGKIGIIICYDLFFPELCKAYALQGADIVICLSASPSTTRKYFETLLPARAIENTVFMIYVNLVGTQEDLTFWGGSQLHSPLGTVLAKSPYFKESCVDCDVDLNDIQRARANRPVIRDMRPEIYHDLYNLSRYHTKPTKK
ncbi:MAG: carbon-nitrogen hydrolase family protein [Candidatus Thermoplasmatota archaeon]|nr:carbon-nitrogen hydrolase family protein [Candidatus Thermoplasmatota archaeon]